METFKIKKNHLLDNSILISFYYTLFILYYFFKDYKFDLQQINNIIYSEANAFGTDINLRVNLYYKLLGLGLPIFFILIFFLNKLFKKLNFDENRYLSFHFIGIIGLVSIITNTIGTKNEVFNYLLFWISLFRILLLITSKLKKNLLALKNDTLFYTVLSSSFLIYYLLLFLFGLKNIEQCIGFILLEMIIIYASIFYLKKYKKLNFRKIIYFITPITIIPIISFIAIEFEFYYFNLNNVFFGYKKTFLILLLVLLIPFYFILIKKKNFKKSINKLITFYFAPSLIISYLLLAFYQPIIEFSNETFELANSTNSMLRIFKFHQLPFIDFLSSHMLYEQWYGILYNIIFGYKNTLDFTIYVFLNKLFLFFTIYYFLNKLFNNSFISTVFIFSFHYLDYVFFQHIFICLIIYFVFQKSIEKNNVKTFFFLFLITFLLIFYRLDTGIVGMMSLGVFLPLWYFINNHEIKILNILKSIFLVLLSTTFLFFIAILLRGRKTILSNLELALHYISNNQAHGKHVLSISYPHQFQLYHLIFPFIIASISAFSIYILYKDRIIRKLSKDKLYLLNTILFLSILFIINFQRGVVRHGFTEDIEYYLVSTFFITLSLFVVYISKVESKIFQFAIFYSVLFSSFIFFKFFPLPIEDSYFERAIKNNTFRTINLSLNKNTFKGRVIDDSLKSMHAFDSLKSFLKINLNSKQTFLDFSNTPALYFYTNNFIPGYFNQNLQNSIDEFSQLKLLKELNPKKVPVVIYSNLPLTWFDMTDDIPNTVRYNLISEYIHSNYKPYKIINGKSIWIAKHLTLTTDSLTPLLYSKITPIYYRRLAEYVGEYYKKKKYDRLGVIFTTQNFIKEKNNIHFIPIHFASKKYHHCYLEVVFSLTSKEKLPIRIQLLDSSNQLVGDFYFENYHTSKKHFFLRVSNNYLWHTKNVKNIKFTLNQGDLLKKVTLYKDLRFEN